jgi:N-acetylneuraminic acid mutarotase
MLLRSIVTIPFTLSVLMAVSFDALIGVPVVGAAVASYTDWTPRESMTTGRLDVAAAATQGKVYAIGGESLGFVIHDQVEEYDPSTDSWRGRARLSSERTAVALAVGADGNIYAFGGNLDGGQSGFRTVKTVEAYDTGTNSWSAKKSMDVNRAYHAAATGGNGKIYVMGGIQTNNVGALTV